jgi:hypothetical protein
MQHHSRKQASSGSATYTTNELSGLFTIAKSALSPPPQGNVIR